MDQPFNWARVMKHEFVHVLNLQQTNFNVPHWFTEALAVLNENTPRPEMWDRLLATRVFQHDKAVGGHDRNAGAQHDRCAQVIVHSIGIQCLPPPRLE